MTKPIRFEHLQPCIDWWGGPKRKNRVETEVAWKVSADEVKARGYNLDFTNPHTIADDHGNPEEWLAKLDAAEGETVRLRDEFKSILQKVSVPKPDRLLTHFERLADTPASISRLRRFILEVAVRGMLVEQDPDEKPAWEPLKLRPPAIEAETEVPFPIPASWLWVRVATVADSRLGKMLDKSKNLGTPRRYLRNINVRWFDFDLTDVLEMRFEDSELKELTLRRGDVLVCEGGEPGRAAVWDDREAGIIFRKHFTAYVSGGQ